MWKTAGENFVVILAMIRAYRSTVCSKHSLAVMWCNGLG